VSVIHCLCCPNFLCIAVLCCWLDVGKFKLLYLGTCESAVCVRIENRIESGVTIRIESRIESAIIIYLLKPRPSGDYSRHF